MGPADSFDYIIVGAGSAGCVLANRLTASGRHRVLLLEAGGHDRHLWIHIPLGYGKLFADRRVNWLYASEPEPELNNRRIIQPRGKVLGGSSSINGLLYVRGQPADFDHWRQLGNAGWSFEQYVVRRRQQTSPIANNSAVNRDTGCARKSAEKYPTRILSPRSRAGGQPRALSGGHSSPTQISAANRCRGAESTSADSGNGATTGRRDIKPSAS